MSPTPALERNRRAIVEAAVHLWATAPQASLGEVARAAGVGRTTVHRHFPDRSRLLAAVDQACREQFDEATRRARPDEGEAMEALHRLCGEYLELGDYLALVIADQPLVDADSWDDSEDDLVALVERGHQDGSIDRSLTATWVVTCLWVLVYASSSVLRSGGVSRREVATMLEKTLGTGLRPVASWSSTVS